MPAGKTHSRRNSAATGALIYSTYLGGVNLDIGNAIAVDGSGNAYIAGQTTSSNLASILGSSNPPTGIFDAFLIKLVPTGDAVAALVYLGGAGADTATAIVLDAVSNIYVAGWTLSPNFPVVNGFQTINGGNYSAFIGKLNLSGGVVSVSVSPTAVALYASQTQQFTAMVSNTANTAVTWSLSPSTGTISSTGLYTAPASIATQQTVTVRATSVADSSEVGDCDGDAVSAADGVTMTPGTSTLYGVSGAAVFGDGGKRGEYRSDMVGEPEHGTISSTGLYTAPENVTTQQTVTVRATSVADSSKSATATVNLLVFQPVLTFPGNGNTALSLTTTLTWNVVTGASSYDVYFGNASPPPLAATVANPPSPATTVLYTPAVARRLRRLTTGGSSPGTEVCPAVPQHGRSARRLRRSRCGLFPSHHAASPIPATRTAPSAARKSPGAQRAVSRFPTAPAAFPLRLRPIP